MQNDQAQWKKNQNYSSRLNRKKNEPSLKQIEKIIIFDYSCLQNMKKKVEISLISSFFIFLRVDSKKKLPLDIELHHKLGQKFAKKL